MEIANKICIAAGVLLRCLRAEPMGPELIIDALLLMIPTIEPVGRCELLPEGFDGAPITCAITEDAAKVFLHDMDGSASFENMQGPR